MYAKNVLSHSILIIGIIIVLILQMKNSDTHRLSKLPTMIQLESSQTGLHVQSARLQHSNSR